MTRYSYAHPFNGGGVRRKEKRHPFQTLNKERKKKTDANSSLPHWGRGGGKGGGGKKKEDASHFASILGQKKKKLKRKNAPPSDLSLTCRKKKEKGREKGKTSFFFSACPAQGEGGGRVRILHTL